jgi:uncharacterized protein YkwD
MQRLSRPSGGAYRMQRWIVIAGCVGCGQVSQAPGGQPPPPASAPALRDPSADDPPGQAADRATADPGVPTQFPAPSPERAEGREPDRSARPGPRPARAPAPQAGTAQAFIDAHNRVRARHCAGPLTWSPKLAAVAQQWANSLRDKGCMFGHSNGAYGENLAAGTTGTLDPEAVVKMWYDEVAHYRFPNGGFSAQTGHFTQVVWRGTTQVGCGRSQCKDMDIWVCEYDPAGNWEGQYRENVRPTGCR